MIGIAIDWRLVHGVIRMGAAMVDGIMLWMVVLPFIAGSNAQRSRGRVTIVIG